MKGKWTHNVIQAMLNRLLPRPWECTPTNWIYPPRGIAGSIGKMERTAEAEFMVCAPEIIEQLLQENTQLKAALQNITQFSTDDEAVLVAQVALTEEGK